MINISRPATYKKITIDDTRPAGYKRHKIIKILVRILNI